MVSKKYLTFGFNEDIGKPVVKSIAAVVKSCLLSLMIEQCTPQKRSRSENIAPTNSLEKSIDSGCRKSALQVILHLNKMNVMTVGYLSGVTENGDIGRSSDFLSKFSTGN